MVKRKNKKNEIIGLYIDVKGSLLAMAIFLGISLGLAMSKILPGLIILKSVVYLIVSIILFYVHLKFNKKFKEEMKLDGGKKKKK